MYEFHVLLRPDRTCTCNGPVVTLRSLTLDTLQFAQPIRSFELSFDETLQSLARIERVFSEPDGSFVCSSDPQGVWQVEGNLVEHDDHLLYVEAWGRCPPAVFDQLLNCVGWPATRIVFECVKEGVVLAEVDFRQFADQT